MQRSTFRLVVFIFPVCWTLAAAQAASADELELSGWRPFSPRDEIRPEFAINPRGGPDGKGGLVIRLDDREGLDGFTNPITGEDYREWRKGSILCGHNLWVSNRDPAREWSFLTVIYPAPPGGDIPPIERIDDSTVRVGDDVVTFDPGSPAARDASFVVDVAAMRGQ